MVKPSKLAIALLAVVLADGVARSGPVAAAGELTQLLSAGIVGRAAVFLLGLSALGAVSFVLVRAAGERGEVGARRRDSRDRDGASPPGLGGAGAARG